MRTLVIGDIHGCYEELLDLLDKAGINDDDHILSVGDIINRGPDSANTIRYFMTMPEKRYAIMGNHEYKLIRAYKQAQMPSLSMLYTRWQLGVDFRDVMAYITQLPIYHEHDDALIVHGYYEPDVPLAEQKEHILIGTNGASSYLEDNYKKPWWRMYKADKPIIVGHKDISGKQQPFNHKDRVFGLDTGCVYGGQLTGLWLPDFEFVSVPARNAHWFSIRAEFLPPS